MKHSSQRLVLAIDLGSGGPKIGYVTVRGEPVWWHYERGDALGGAEAQDPNDWWDIIVKRAREGLSQPDVIADNVIGVAVTGQWSSTVPVDEHGEPVSDCLMWSDTAGAAHSQQLFGGPVAGYSPRVLASWIRRSGGAPSPTGSDPISHMLHLDRDLPEVAKHARWYLEPVDQLTMRFTGIAAASPMSMTGAWLTDNRDLSRVQYDPVLLKLSGLNSEKLPPLVQSGSIIGPILPEVADLIGLPHSVQVITGAPDLQNAIVASGNIEPLQAHISLGTSSWISCPVTKKKTDIFSQIAAIPGIGDGYYVMVNNQDNAGRALEWFRSTLMPHASYTEIADLTAQSPAGANSVIFAPWLSGERSPVDDRHARGGFHNISLTSTTADLTRAVLEGVAMNMRWLLGAAEKFAGSRFDSIRLIGGGAQIDIWCQILADVCDRRIERVENPLVSGLRGAGLYFGLQSGAVTRNEIRELVPIDRIFEPQSETRAIYEALMFEFPQLHRNNKKMFVRLNR